MRNLQQWFAFASLCTLVACGGGGGGGNGGGTPDPDPDPIVSDPAMVVAVQSAFAASDPDAALQEFYQLTGSVSYDVGIKSLLDALQTGADTESVRSVILNSGQIFGFESPVLPAAVANNPCGNQQPTVVWFVNGILNSPWDALESVRELKKVVAEANIGVPVDAVFLNYNRSGLDTSYPAHELCLAFFGANGSDDPIFEINRYWDEAFQRSCAGISGLLDWGEAFAQWLNNWADLDLPADDPEVSKFRASLQQDIDGGKRVIIVAHSQGNFFAQRAVEGLSASDRQAVAVIALATPANYIESVSYGYFDYLTLEDDAILLTPLAFPSNGSNALSDAGASGKAIHSFVKSYLDQSTSRNRVKQMLQGAASTISNPNALGAKGFLEITAKWFESGDVDLFVGEDDFVNDQGAEVYWEFPDGTPQHLFGHFDHIEQVGPGYEHYVVCSKADLREGCFEIRLFPFGIPVGAQIHVTIRAGTRVWQFIEFNEGSSIIVTHMSYHSSTGTFALTDQCVPPSVFDETDGK